MIASNPLRARLGILLRGARRRLPTAILVAALGTILGAGPAFAIRPESANPGIQGKSNPYRSGFKHLRRLQTGDLLAAGQAPGRDRIALAGDASAEILRRLNAKLKASGGEARIRSVATDAKGNRHIRVDLYHQGYPVIGGDAVIHVNAANEIYAVGGNLAEGLSPAAAPRLDADSARKLARAGLARPSAATEKQAPRLVIFDGTLAYETLIEEPGFPPHLWKSYHDAATGKLLFRANRIVDAAPVGGAPQNVTGSLLQGEGGAVATISGWHDSAGFYFLRNDTEKWGVYDEVKLDWSQNTTGDWGTTDRAAVSLARNEELTQKYVSQVLGRNSFDNAGALAVANVHYGSSYVNAFWDGSQFNFGDGDNVESGPLTVLDVAAHEYGHAITQYTSNLDYVDESGALNESYSDILGTLVEFWAQPDGRSAYPAAVHGSADWLMGEDCWLSSDALRDMRNPQRYGQPSYYGGTYWSVGSGDNGGVHTNSGVQNFAFYLLSEGGNGSNDGHAYSIVGLGQQQAGAIAMYANMYLLTSIAQYSDTRAAWILAATTLGYNAQTVRDVWTACGVLEQVHNLAVSPASLAFGNVGTGSSSILNLTLTNNGANATTVTGLTFDNAAFSSAAALPLSVPGGGTVQLPVRFLPAASGPQSGTLTIASDALDNPVLTVSLTGTGAPPAHIAVSPASISGSAPVGAVQTATLHVTNTGVADLHLTPRVQETGAPALQATGSWNVLLLEAAPSPIDFEAPLRALPNVASLTTWNGYTSLPTLNDLRPYDAVIVVAEYAWISPSGIGDVLADYVDGGGSVILMGATFHSGGDWALQGRVMTSGYAPLAAATYSTSSVSSATLANHPINAGVTTLTSGLFALVTAPQGSGISLGTYTGGYLLGAYNPDKPIVSLNAYPQAPYYGGDLLVQVRNALDFVAKPKWLSIAGDGQDIVVPQGGSKDLQVTLDATNVMGGTYTGNILLTHNDPSVPNPFTVPVTFAVDGFRRLAVTPPAEDFGNVLTGMADTLSLTLANAGDEVTTISDINVTGSPDFSIVGAAPASIPGKQSAVVKIEFRPHTVGTQTASLNIASDAEDNPALTGALTGTGAIPSMIQLTPDHVQADVDAGGTAVRTLTVGNVGGSDLQYAIAGNDGRVLINEFSNEPDFIELWNQGPDRDMGGWTLSWVDDASSSVLSFVFPSGYTLRSGRRVVVRENTGVADDSTFYAGANIGWVQGSTVAVTLADAAGNGIDFVRTLNSTTQPPAGAVWTGGGVDFSSYSAYRNQNADTDGPTGWATSMTPSEFFLNPGQSPVTSLPAWLSVAPDSGTVPASQSQDVTLTFNAGGLLASTYSANLYVKSNDPSTPPAGMPVPVAFTVRGARHLAASPATLAFGNVWAGSSLSLSLVLRNDGNEATTIASLASDNPGFVVPSGTLTVPAFGSLTVPVAFSPAEVGAQSGTLTISGDAQDNPVVTVALTGTGTPPPSASLAPASFALTLAPNQTPVDRTATLSNVGGDNLSWHIASIAQTGSPLGQTVAAAPALPAIQPRLIYAESNYAHPYVPGRVIVAFKPGLSAFAGLHTAADVGIEEMRELARAVDPKTHRKAYTGRSLMLLELKDPDGVRQAVDILRQDANVAYAEPDYIQKATAIPNDPSFNLLYGMHNTGQTGGVPGADIHATEAWDKHTGNKSILIGVIDTGIDYTHPDLAANIWTNPGEIPGNGIDDDGNGFVDDVHGWDFAYDDSDPMDGHYHGTHVSGTIAGAGDNGVGVAGVMWTASLVAIKFLDDSGSGATSDAIDAVNYAQAMGVRITNNSWGGGAFSQALMDAIAAGGLFVAAAGNSSSDNDTSPQYPASYALDNIISVAATDNADALASFSSYGLTTVDLGAPGVDIYSAEPGGLYQYLSGTSMATPHVSGAAGLVWSYNPLMTAAQVKAALLSTVDPDPALAGKTVTGGRLNVNRALDQAGPSWLTAVPTAPGVLAPGASAPITVTVNPAGLAAGEWTGVVNVATDDPLHPQLPITVTATISGCRSLEVTPAAHDFGDQFVGSVTAFNVTLHNACNDAVTVSAAASADSAFSLASSLPLTVPAFKDVTVPVQFHPAAAGAVSADLLLTTDADTDPIKSIVLSGAGVLPPVVSVNPTQVNGTLSPGASTKVDLEIDNTGGSDLTWTLAGVDQGAAAQATYDASHFAPQDRNLPDQRVGYPVTSASGGPDAFGYRWIDSDQPGGPAYQWQDIKATGTPVLQACLDCNVQKPLSFAFPLYGNKFTQVNITSKGWVNFGTAILQYTNYPIPSTSMPNDLVAAFFDDLTTTNGGVVYFQDFGDRAVIQWDKVGYFSGTGDLTFEMVLHADGTIEFFYENMNGSVLSGTTGIQNDAATVGLQVQYNTAYIKNHLAVRISTLPTWLRASVVSGTVPAGGSQHVDLTLDAALLAPGNYSQVLTLTDNSPSQPSLQIPVALTVVGVPGTSRVLRVGPSALAAAAGSRYFMWNMTVGGEVRGLAKGSRYSLYLK